MNRTFDPLPPANSHRLTDGAPALPAASRGFTSDRALFRLDLMRSLRMHCRLALGFALAGLLLAVIASASHPRSAALLGAGTASALLLGLLDRMRKHLTPLALRAGADLVLLTPVLLFLR